MPYTVHSYFSSRFELLPGLNVYQHLLHTPATTVLTLLDMEEIERKLTNETDSKLLIQFLSPEERKKFAAYSYPKRQREWLAGRIVCKYAVLQLLHDSTHLHQFPTFSVLPCEDGSPQLFFPDTQIKVPSVSITHSGRYAAAMAGFVESCGIDIQHVLAKIKNVVSRFAAPEEVKLLDSGLPSLGEEERLTLLWSAKEALKKSLLHNQPVIFKGIHLQSLSNNKVTSMLLRSTAKEIKTTEVTALLLDEYALAFTASGVNHA